MVLNHLLNGMILQVRFASPMVNQTQNHQRALDGQGRASLAEILKFYIPAVTKEKTHCLIKIIPAVRFGEFVFRRGLKMRFESKKLGIFLGGQFWWALKQKDAFTTHHPTMACDITPIFLKIALPPTRWWQLKYFLCSSRSLGFHDPIWRLYSFQGGWFNHQLDLGWLHFLICGPLNLPHLKPAEKGCSMFIPSAPRPSFRLHDQYGPIVVPFGVAEHERIYPKIFTLSHHCHHCVLVCLF